MPCERSLHNQRGRRGPTLAAYQAGRRERIEGALEAILAYAEKKEAEGHRLLIEPAYTVSFLSPLDPAEAGQVFRDIQALERQEQTNDDETTG